MTNNRKDKSLETNENNCLLLKTKKIYESAMIERKIMIMVLAPVGIRLRDEFEKNSTVYDVAAKTKILKQFRIGISGQ